MEGKPPSDRLGVSAPVGSCGLSGLCSPSAVSLGAGMRSVTQVTAIRFGSSGLRGRCSLSTPLESGFFKAKPRNPQVLSPAPYFLLSEVVSSGKVWVSRLGDRQQELIWMGVVFAET